MEIYSTDVISQLKESKFGFGYCKKGINSISHESQYDSLLEGVI